MRYKSDELAQALFESRVATNESKIKWVENPKNTWRMEGDKPGPNTYHISKTPSGRITKSSGYDVKLGIQQIEHFSKLADAKKYIEGLAENESSFKR